MTNTQKLIDSFQTTTWIIHKQADGLSHEDSVRQLPFRGNCFNWVLGHIVEHRDQVLAALGAPALLSEAEAALYRTRSEPITDGETAVPLPKLLRLLDEGQAAIAAALNDASAEQLEAIYSAEHNQTVGDRVAGLHWHETYHTGQLEILRQLAGTNDRILG